MKSKGHPVPEGAEGSEFARFTALVDTVIAVPRSKVDERDAEYQRQAQANPSRRGPKPKKAKPLS